jgi:hypothetical protein
MPDHQRSIVIEAPTDATFSRLSDPANLPKYLRMMWRAERTQHGLRVTAQGEGGAATERDVDFAVDERARTFRWHPDGSEYHGEIAVADEKGRSRVSIALHVTPKAEPAQVQQALNYVEARIREALER